MRDNAGGARSRRRLRLRRRLPGAQWGGMARLRPDSFESLLVSDTVGAARALLGAHLCRRRDDGSVGRFQICETEAYDGFSDRASHAARGRTGRNAPMYGPAGVWYVYLCYGMHEMLNLVAREAGHPAAILLRGAWETDARGRPARRIDGPGRLTRALGVGRREFNAREALPACGLWVEPGVVIPESEVLRTPRIGVDYAGAEWAAMPWRFVIQP